MAKSRIAEAPVRRDLATPALRAFFNITARWGLGNEQERTLLGSLGINIANFNLGRADVGGDAIALVSIDGELSDGQLKEIAGLEGVKQAKAVRF